jgi:hypothetical protein
VAWYLKGYVVGHEVRAELALVTSLARFDRIVAELDPRQPYPGGAAEGHRGRGGSPRRVTLPEGWLDSRELDPVAHPGARGAAGFAADLAETELAASGG